MVQTSISAAVRTLYLPMPDSAFRTGQPASVVHDLAKEDLATLLPPDHAAEVAAYRWLIGHHAAICGWRLLQENLSDLVDQSVPAPHLVAQAAAMYDLYSIMLLYCASCTPETYHAVIRPEIMATDPAFSGRWSRDFEPIMPLLKAVRQTHSAELLEPLSAAFKRNLLVHSAVGRYLVPDGDSLLRESGRSPSDTVTDNERNLFDRHFHIKRATLSRSEFDNQLLLRLRLIELDTARRPLRTPDAPQWSPKQTEVVDRLHNESPLLLSQLRHRCNDVSIRPPRPHSAPTGPHHISPHGSLSR